MKRTELENNKKLIESDYNDMTLYVESFKVGAKAWVVNKNYIEEGTEEVEDMVVVCAIHRKDDPEKYDGFPENSYLTLACDRDFDTSGEFVLDDDIVYVYLDYAEK